MKAAIHPEYVESHVRCTCGNEFTTRSTKPELHVEICSNCHPFYTGRQKLVDTGGRVERFQRRAAKRRKYVATQAKVAEDTRLPDGALMAQRDAPVGGQAVLEGVMMRGVSTWAVAVRKPLPEEIAQEKGVDPRLGAHGEIEVQSFPLVSILKKHRWMRLPVIRGVFALWESLRIGFRALNISANAQLPPGEAGEAEEIGKGMWIGTVIFAIALAVGLFFLLPVGLTSLFKDSLPNSVVFVVVEKLIRIAIFLGYLVLISRLPDLRRVFEYHGAEHKTIACYEAGQPLTPENARLYSRLHPRCGTSFLLIVMVVAIVVFAPLGTPAWYILFPSRVIGIPLVAGLAFEAIKWFGRNRRKRWARALMWPGLQLQRLTTREPDAAQLAVAIAALEAVLAVENPLEASEEERAGMEVAA
jgi:ribosomal protein L31